MQRSHTCSRHAPAIVQARASGISAAEIRASLLGRKPGIDCHVLRLVAARDNSRLFYAECSGAPGPVAIKACLKSRSEEPDAEAARRQYDALVRVHAAMGEGAQFSVPKPWLLMPERALVASEWIAGENLAAALFSWTCDGERALELAARCGSWLKHFHACRVAEPRPIDVEDKLAFLFRMRKARQVDEPLFDEALACLRRAAQRAGETVLPCSWIHGDFTADNVMTFGTRTVCIDVDGRYENTVVHDLAPFLNDLDLRAFHPGGWRRGFALAKLRRAFIGSYLDGANGAVGVPLAWVRLHMILQTWTTALANARSPMRRRFAELSHRAVAARLIRLLDAR